MTEEQKTWIDNASYEELLRKWRFGPAGDPIFEGDTGKHYGEIIAKRKNEIGEGVHTIIKFSNLIGFN